MSLRPAIVQVTAYRALTILAILSLATSINRISSGNATSFLPVVLFSIFALVTLFCAWDCTLGAKTSLYGLRAYSLLTIALIIASWPVASIPPDELGLFLLTGLLASAICWPTRISFACAGLMPLGLYPWQAREEDPRLALVACLLFTEMSLFSNALYRGMSEVTLALEASTNRAVIARNNAARDVADAIAISQTVSTIHDKVLGALLMTIRSMGTVPRSAAQLAQEGLSALTGARASSLSIIDEARRCASRLGIDVSIQISGRGPLQVERALATATCEAITNVARHSGGSEAQIVGSLGPTECRLTIRDHGTGEPFTPGLGVKESIVGAMESVQGEAHVLSNPTKGTSVELLWRHPENDPVEDIAWNPTGWIPLFYGLALAALSGRYIITAMQPSGHFIWPTFGKVVVPLIALAGALLCLRDGTSAHMRRLYMGLASMTLVLAWMNLNPPIRSDFSFWYLGMLTPIACAASFRQTLNLGAGWFAVTSCCVLLIDHWRGDNQMLAIVASLSVALSGIAASALVRIGLETATREFRRSADLIVSSHQESGLASAARRENDLAISELGEETLQLLRALTLQKQLTSGELSQCIVVEREVRDHLTSLRIVGPKLRDEVRAARGRNVEVIVEVHALQRDETLELAFAELCCNILGTLNEGKVIILWFGDTSPGGLLGSIVAEGSDPRLGEISHTVPTERRDLRIRASIDPYAALLEVYRPAGH